MAIFSLGSRGSAVFLLFVELFFLAQLDSTLRFFIALGATCLALVTWRSVAWAYRLLSPLLVLSPLLGTYSICALVAGWLLGRNIESRNVPALSGNLRLVFDIFAFVFVLGFLNSLLWDFDWVLFTSIFDYGSFSAVMQHLRATYVPWYASLKFLLMLALAGMLFRETLSNLEEHFEKFLFWLSLGAGISAIYGLCQILDIAHFFQLNRGAFWLHVDRYNATFTDPNAFGVLSPFIAALALSWIYFEKKPAAIHRLLSFASAFSLLCVAHWSGSRTLWIAVLILIAGFFVILLKRKPGLFKSVLFSGCIAAGLLALLVIPSVNERVQESVPSPSVQRLAKTIHLDHAAEMLYSRSLSARVAAKVLEEQPFLGVGGGRYRLVQRPIAESLGEGQGDWWDNANNFYLQILTEQGILGFCLLILAFWILAKCTRTVDVCSLQLWKQWGMVAMLLVLLTGPHIEFAEVLFFWTVFIASATKELGERKSSRLRSVYFSFALILALGLGSLSISEKHAGLYQVEDSPLGKVAWTAGRAKLVWCEEEADAKLLFRAMTPKLRNEPLDVTVFVNGQLRESIKLSSVDVAEVALGDLRKRDKVWLNTSRVWRPVDEGRGADARVLGVQVLWPTSACERWGWK